MKNRSNIYVVIRELQGCPTAILGVFENLLEADNKKDSWAAEWFDKTKGQPADFSVQISTFYAD